MDNGESKDESKKYPLLFIDADGYTPGRTNIEILATKLKPGGFRVRELGWLLAPIEGKSSIGNIVYYDGAELTRLRETKNVRWIRDNLHGLPVNPTKDSYPSGSIVHESRDLLTDIRALIANAKKSVGDSLIVVHKGGPEGAWVAAVAPGTKTLDLNHYGCPRIEKLATVFVGNKSCGLHGRLINHCPVYEVSLMFQWWAASGAVPRESKPANKSVELPKKSTGASPKKSAGASPKKSAPRRSAPKKPAPKKPAPKRPAGASANKSQRCAKMPAGERKKLVG